MKKSLRPKLSAPVHRTVTGIVPGEASSGVSPSMQMNMIAPFEGISPSHQMNMIAPFEGISPSHQMNMIAPFASDSAE